MGARKGISRVKYVGAAMLKPTKLSTFVTYWTSLDEQKLEIKHSYVDVFCNSFITFYKVGFASVLL